MQGASRQHYAQLFAAIACCQITAANRLQQNRADRYQHAIARQVAARIVEMLEAIEVQHDHADGLAVLGERPRERAAQRGAIEQARERAPAAAAWLQDFDADALRAWARELGVDTYVGSSGRVFPLDRKAAPLLRGWVRRLKEQGVAFHVQHRWLGWSDDGALRFATPAGDTERQADATVLALGGGSWPQLGSDGAWQTMLQQHGIAVRPLVPANCGFDIDWSAHFSQRHAGAPLKPVVADWRDSTGTQHALQGECVITATGIEGSLIYAIAAELRRLGRAVGR